MSFVKPDQLRALRDRRGWTRAQLAQLVRVSEKTISRLENAKNPPKRGPRAETMKRLAHALDTSPEELARTRPSETQPDGPNSEPPAAVEIRSQVNLRMKDFARNALLIAAKRYHVSQQDIIDLAPLLFICVAERSLAYRREMLEEIDKKSQEMFEIGKEFPYLPTLLWANPRSDELVGAERESIKANDICAQEIDMCNYEGCLPDDFDEGRDNPFARYLHSFVADSTPLVDCRGFLSKFASYEISSRLTLDIVGDDEEAASAITSGQAALHKMPRNLTETAARAEWAKAEAARTTAEARAFFEELDALLDAPPASRKDGEEAIQ